MTLCLTPLVFEAFIAIRASWRSSTASRYSPNWYFKLPKAATSERCPTCLQFPQIFFVPTPGLATALVSDSANASVTSTDAKDDADSILIFQLQTFISMLNLRMSFGQRAKLKVEQHHDVPLHPQCQGQCPILCPFSLRIVPKTLWKRTLEQVISKTFAPQNRALSYA